MNCTVVASGTARLHDVTAFIDPPVGRSTADGVIVQLAAGDSQVSVTRPLKLPTLVTVSVSVPAWPTGMSIAKVESFIVKPNGIVELLPVGHTLASRVVDRASNAGTRHRDVAIARSGKAIIAV